MVHGGFDSLDGGPDRCQSITERIFTAADQAQNHCQVGNFGLALEVMSSWMAEVEAVSQDSVSA